MVRPHRVVVFVAVAASSAFAWACASGETPADPGGKGDSLVDAGVAVDSTVAIDADVPIEAVLSQSTSEVITAGSIACITSVGGTPRNLLENSYYRVFDLAALGIDSDFDISKVTVGIESATSGAGGNQPIKVRLHTLFGTFVTGNLTQLASVDVSVPDQTNSMLDVDIAATAPAGSLLVVEVFLPDAEGVADHLFFIGSNKDGESGPSYLRGPTCDFLEPIPISTIQVDGANVVMHLVLTVTGTS